MAGGPQCGSRHLLLGSRPAEFRLVEARTAPARRQGRPAVSAACNKSAGGGARARGASNILAAVLGGDARALHRRLAQCRGLWLAPAAKAVMLRHVPTEGVSERLEAEGLQRPQHVTLVDLRPSLAPNLDPGLAGHKRQELGAAHLHRLDRVTVDLLGLHRVRVRLNEPRHGLARRRLDEETGPGVPNPSGRSASHAECAVRSAPAAGGRW